MSAPIQLPARVGKYELLEYLGGGMSHVFRATDTILGRTVALKILTPQGNKDPEVRARFLQEARMASNINHDNIIKVHDFGEEGGRPFMVMEFLRGESLRDAIRGGRTGDVTDKLNTSLQIARALEYIQARKIIHRDIKPENIHIDPSGKVKLMDFGIAKSEGLSLTRAGFTLGTPYYMAPEQVMGQPPTGQVDVYAFGVVMVELLSGSKPIQADTVEKIFQQILYQPLNLEPLEGKGIPPAVLDLIRRCTAKKPEERMPGFGSVCAELERILGGAAYGASSQQQPQHAAAVPARVPSIFAGLPPRFQSPLWISLISALAVVAALGILLVLGRLLSSAF